MSRYLFFFHICILLLFIFTKGLIAYDFNSQSNILNFIIYNNSTPATLHTKNDSLCNKKKQFNNKQCIYRNDNVETEYIQNNNNFIDDVLNQNTQQMHPIKKNSYQFMVHNNISVQRNMEAIDLFDLAKEITTPSQKKQKIETEKLQQENITPPLETIEKTIFPLPTTSKTHPTTFFKTTNTATKRTTKRTTTTTTVKTSTTTTTVKTSTTVKTTTTPMIITQSKLFSSTKIASSLLISNKENTQQMKSTNMGRAMMDSVTLCYVHGIGFSKQDLRHVHRMYVKTFSECQKNCAATESCTAFEFDFEKNVCFGTSQNLHDIRFAVSLWSITSPMLCNVEAPICDKVGVWYMSETHIALLNNVALWDCHKACSKNSQCSQASYDLQNHDCALLGSSALSGILKPIYGDEYITLLQNCHKGVTCEIKESNHVHHQTFTLDPESISEQKQEDSSKRVQGYTLTKFSCSNNELELIPPGKEIHMCQPDGRFLDIIPMCGKLHYRIAIFNDDSFSDDFIQNYKDNLQQWLIVSTISDYNPFQNNNRPLADYLQGVSTIIIPPSLIQQSHKEIKFKPLIQRLIKDPNSIIILKEFVKRGGLILIFIQGNEDLFSFLFEWTLGSNIVCESLSYSTTTVSNNNKNIHIYPPELQTFSKDTMYNIAVNNNNLSNDIYPLLECKQNSNLETITLSPLIQRVMEKGNIVAVGFEKLSKGFERNSVGQVLLQTILELSNDPIIVPGLTVTAKDICHFYDGSIKMCSSGEIHCIPKQYENNHSDWCSSTTPLCTEASIPCIPSDIKPKELPQCPEVIHPYFQNIRFNAGQNKTVNLKCSNEMMMLTLSDGTLLNSAQLICKTNGISVIEVTTLDQKKKQNIGINDLLCTNPNDENVLVLGQTEPESFSNALKRLCSISNTELGYFEHKNVVLLRLLLDSTMIKTLIIPPQFYKTHMNYKIIQPLLTFVDKGGLIIDLAGFATAINTFEQNKKEEYQISLLRECSKQPGSLLGHSNVLQHMNVINTDVDNVERYLTSIQNINDVIAVNIPILDGLIKTNSNSSLVVDSITCQDANNISNELDLVFLQPRSQGFIYSDFMFPQLYWYFYQNIKGSTTTTSFIPGDIVGYSDLVLRTLLIIDTFAPKGLIEFQPPNVDTLQQNNNNGTKGDYNIDDSQYQKGQANLNSRTKTSGLLIGSVTAGAILLISGAAASCIITRRNKLKKKTAEEICQREIKEGRAVDQLTLLSQQLEEKKKKQTEMLCNRRPNHSIPVNNLRDSMVSTIKQGVESSLHNNNNNEWDNTRSLLNSSSSTLPSKTKPSSTESEDKMKCLHQHKPSVATAELEGEIANLRQEIIMLQMQLDTYGIKLNNKEATSGGGPKSGRIDDLPAGSSRFLDANELFTIPLQSTKQLVTPSSLENAFSPNVDIHQFEFECPCPPTHSVISTTDSSSMASSDGARRDVEKIYNYGPTIAELDEMRQGNISYRKGAKNGKRTKRSSGFISRPHVSVKKGLH